MRSENSGGVRLVKRIFGFRTYHTIKQTRMNSMKICLDFLVERVRHANGFGSRFGGWRLN
jgi:hypothetical protein